MTISDELLEALMTLPKVPSKPMSGNGFARVNFPAKRTPILRRVWAAIPDAHKDRMLGAVSTDAFDAIRKYSNLWE